MEENITATLKLKAGDLLDALKPVSRRQKAFPIALEYNHTTETLAIIEAKHATFANDIPAFGKFIDQVQLDGAMLYRLTSRIPIESEIELTADKNHLTIKFEKSMFKIARTDDGGISTIKRTPPKPDKRHKGKVEIPPETKGKRVELSDTWGFSLRVPMPQHRDPKNK